SCTAIVTIEDTEDPVAVCQNITVQLDASGNATITAAQVDNGSYDNCGTPSLALDITSFDCTKLGANTVTLTVTDGNGNSHSCAANVTVKDDDNPVTITATPTQTSIDCYGGNATVTIAVSGGVGILTYTFDGVPNNNGIFNNIVAGTYNWSVTNSLGCGNTSGTFEVQQAGDLSATVALTDVTCSSGADGTITVTNSAGGSGNYEYSNNGGSTWQSSNIFSGLIPGSYNVQIRDAAVPTCLKILDADVVIFTLTANVAYTDVNCNSANNGTITVTSPFGGSGSYNYSINGGATWSPNGTFVNLAPGTYNVQIQDANDLSCIVELNSAVEITEPPVMTADVTLTHISCFGAGDGSITVSNPQGGHGTYEVSLNGSNWFTISAVTPYTFNNLSPNSYTVMIRDLAQISCILNISTSVINEPSVLSATLTHTNVTCYGFNDGIINVSAPLGGNGTYQVSINGTDWFDVSVAVPYAFNSLLPGNYTVQIRDAGQTSCSVTITPEIVITEPPLVTVNDPGPQDFCNVASTTPINLTGSPGGVVFDITGGTSIGLADQIGVTQIPSFATIPGSAIVTIIPRANGCTGTSVDVIITVSPIPTANMPVDVIFCNNVLSDPFPLTGTPANVVFDITGGASIGLPDATNVTAIPPFTPITGTATVTITPKVGNNCTGAAVSFPVTVRPTLTASISGSDAIVCRNATPPPTITFINPMALPVEILYNINGGPDLSIDVGAGSSFPIFTSTNVAGVFSYNLVGVKYQTKPDCFFNITGSAVVTVLETPLASISGTNTVCQDAASPLLTFTNPINSMVRVTYNVNGINPATIDVPALSTATYPAPTSAAGTFIYNLVSAEFPDSPSCSNIITGSATIIVLPKPTVTITGETTVCKNTTDVNVTITNPQTLPVRITYTVNNGTPVTTNIGAGSSTTISVNTSNPGNFIYKVTSVQYIAPSPNCINNVDISATVVVLPPPTASISGNATVCLNDVQPVITFTNPQAIPVTVTYNINGVIQPPVDIAANSTAIVSAATSTANTFVYNLVSVVYQGSNSCVNNITGSATVIVRPVPSVSISGDATVCQFASPSPNVTITNQTNFSVTVTYRRNGINQIPVTILPNLSSPIPVPTATLVNYLYELVSVQYQNAPNCPVSATGNATVNILAAPTVTVTGTTTVCPNDPEPVITFVNPQALPIAVTYNISGTIQPVLNIGAGGTETVLAPTAISGIFNYNVVSVAYQSGAACANTASGAFATVTVKTAPATPVAGNNGPVCVGSPLSLTANTIAGATYNWTGPNGFTSPLQNPTVSANATAAMAGIYSVTATVAGCISPVGTTTVVVNEVPAAPVANNNGPVCIGSSLSLTASNITGATYNWTGPNGFTANIQNPTVSANATMAMAGTYTVSVIVNGCVGTPATTNVIINQVPIIPNQVITSCNASAFVVSPQNGVPAGTVVPTGTTYSWPAPAGSGFTGGSAQSNQISISQTLTLANANVGATAIYTVTPNSNGCNGTPFTVTINIDPIPLETNVMWYLWPTGSVDPYLDYNEWSQCAAQSDLASNHNDLDVVVRIGGVWQRPTSTTFDNYDDFGWQYSFESNSGPWDNLPPTDPPLFRYIMPPAPSAFTRLGDHYFRFFVTKDGCTTYSDIILMHMISNFTLVVGETPPVNCSASPTPIQLTGNSVSGTGPAPGNIAACARWSIESLDPINGNQGTLTYQGLPYANQCLTTANLNNVYYTPPPNYTGTVTLKLETNDPDGNGECSSIFEYRTITISPVAGAVAGNPVIVCAGTPVQLNGSVYGSATGGIWSVTPVGTGTFSDINSLTSTYTPPVNFTGTVTLTLTPNVPVSCIEISSVDITVNSAPQTSGVNICEGESGSFTLLSPCPSGGEFTIGPNSADSGVNTTGIGTSAWSNPNQAISNNNSFATVSLSASGVTTSNYLRVTDYDFSIPGNATITGITVTIGRRESSTSSGADVQDVQVRLLRNGVLAGDNKANTTQDWPTSETPANYGSSSDLWGTTWTAADINNNNFGVSLVVNSDNNRTAYVDYIYVAVTYSIAGEINWYSSTNSVTPIGIGSPFNPVGVAGSGLLNTNTPGTTTFYAECATYPGCRTATNFVINPKPVVTKPGDYSESACIFADQAALDAAFATWISEFSVSGGATPVGSFAGTPTAPTLCTGGTVTAVYNYTDDCETGSVSATFTVTPPPALTVNNPGDKNSFSCDYINQAAVQTAFTNWLSGFTTTGGCSPVGTFTGGTPAAPPICGGSVTVSYNVSDLCENGTETATFTISGTASVLLNKPDPKVAPACDFTDQAALDADFANWLTGFTVVSGGCAGSASYGFPVAPALCTGGTTEVTYLYQDVCATASVTQTYTINAPDEIVINEPADPNLDICSFADQAAVDAAFASWLTGFSVTGGCGGGTGTFSTTTAPALCGSGTVDVTYTYTDNCQSKSETASFTLDNTNSLVINKPANVDDQACFYGSQEDLNTFFADWLTGFSIAGGCGASGSYGTPSAPDLCAGGTTTVTYNVTDNCGNIFTETATFKISIQGDLTFVKPAPFTAPPCNYANQNELNLEFQNWLTGFGVSGGCNPVGSYGNPVAPNLCEGGTVTVVYTATDVCITSSVSQTFTVEAVEPIQAVQMQEHFAPPCLSQTEMDAEFAAWISTFAYTGGCNVHPPSLEAFTAPPACGGSVVVNYTFYDDCGQTATGSAVFTVEPDGEDPVITCPADFEGVLIDNGSCQATLELIPPAATDNCSAFGAITFTNNAPVQFPVGTTIVIWTATDICGNSSTCEQSITVLDNDEAPVITNCPENAEDVIIGAGCSMITGEITEPTITDNCPDPELHYEIVYPDGSIVSGIGSVSNMAFPVGVSTVTYIAVDDAGNPSLPCTFTVWIKDLVPPEFEVSCPVTTITVDAPDGICNAFVNVPGPLVSDPCDELVTLSHNSIFSTNSTNADGTYPVGTTTVIWTATDLSGNTTTCEQDIIVRDVTAPEITCPGEVSGFANIDDCVATGVDLGTPTATDDCSAPVTFANDAPAVFPVGNTTVTWTATDAAGNIATCTQLVTISDNNQFPYFTFCPPNQEQTTTADNCKLIDIVIPNPEFEDNCGVVTLTWTIEDPDGSIRNSNPIDTNYVSGETFFVGVSTVTYIAYDAAGNPSDPCIFTVWIKDFVKPEFTAGCPPNVGPVPTDEGVCTAAITIPTPVVNDPCGEGYTLTNNYTGDFNFPIGVTTITWTIVDASDNVTTCDQEIEVIESQLLAVDCPGDITRSVAPGDDFVSGIVVGNPTIHESCFESDLTWVMVPPAGYESMYTPAQLSGDGIFAGTGTYYLGVTTVTYTLTDENSTTATCDFTITITTAPEIECAADQTFDANENCEYPFNPGVPTLIQGIPPIDWTWTLTNPDLSTSTGGSSTPDDGLVPLPVVADAPHEYPFQIGTTTIDWTATNVYGTGTCRQTIIVVDNQKPTFTADGFEGCVENLMEVTYTGVSDILAFNIDYEDHDYYIMRIGSDILNIDMTSYSDNCCYPTDDSGIRWEIDFEGNAANEPTISGTGQPSDFGSVIYLWGDGVNFLPRTHKITYWITDCHGTESDPVTADITINPRPKVGKL
ncbi:MAG: HYR domain-containing protein, partial [Bacteroidales bacterium]|nr:HYR domain-containing protein [Bacteroidales bacterium]